MKVLLTGAAGLVGRVAYDQLIENHEVTALDIRPVEGVPNSIRTDVLDLAAVTHAMGGHDAVVNTIMAPNPSYSDGGPGFTVNVTGMYNLLEASKTCGVRRFVHTSSGAVHTGYPESEFLENDKYPLKASTPYALSKLLQEELARNFHEQHDISIACIRPWAIFNAETMVYTDGKPVTGYSYGSIDCRDVASALVRALETPDIGYECFYVMATPGGYKRADVARTEARLGWKPARTFDADLN
ncbi:MAG: NAD(P)-dependent oxidoreductase [Candidatus Latescibacterota bacterium]|nr:NAD(P)-dependent oxidoreductase [Candidatus Latescibacterota bacterium]